MQSNLRSLWLADDDEDDCFLFKEALKELPVPAKLFIVNDGVELMDLLTSNIGGLPEILFLDLNMPLKNGVDCLMEIKRNDQLKSLPVMIYSTSLDEDVVNFLYGQGAYHYIRKPTEFSTLKNVITEALKIFNNDRILQPSRDKFVILS